MVSWVAVCADATDELILSKQYVDTVDIDTAVYHFSRVDVKNSPEKIKKANEQISHVLERARKENYARMKMIIICASAYAFRNEQYETGFRLLEDMYQNQPDLPLDAKVLLNKNRAVFYNKLGLFNRSVEILEEGLEMAEKLDNNRLILDFNTHLAHEYNYLSLLDNNYVEEVNRLNRNSYNYAIKLGDSSEIYLQYFNLLERNASLREIENRKQEALQYISTLEPEEAQGLKTSILHQYLFVIFRNQYYQEYIQDAAPYQNESWYLDDPVFSTYTARAYLELNEYDKARKYALIAKEVYEKSEDNDRKRTALFYLPGIFGDLKMYNTAIAFSKERNHTFKNQIIVFNSLTKEVKKFNTEIKKEETKSKHQTAIKKALLLCLVLVTLVVIVIIVVSRSIRNKNKIIEKTLNQVETVNSKLNQANYDLESFAYASAHDIKNPLHSISGFVQLIKLDDDNKLSEEASLYLSHVDESIENISNLINSILKYAKVGNQKLKLEELEIRQKIEKTKLLLHQQILENSATIVIENPLPTVMASPDLLQQVILNIVSNAIKYHRPGHDPILQISSSPDEDFENIKFRDNGIGIPEENLLKIFDLFGRAQNSGDYDGVGVGLAVCMKIVKMHGGELLVSNNTDHGSTFTLRLPKVKHKTKTNSSQMSKKQVEV